MTKPVRRSPKAVEGVVVDSNDQPLDDNITRIQITPTLSVLARKPTEGQMTVIAKATAAASRDPASSLMAMDIVFRVITKLLVKEGDVDRLDEAMIDGVLDINDLMKIFGEEESADDAKPVKPRAARR